MFLTVTMLQEIESFMTDSEKKNPAFFPKLVPPFSSQAARYLTCCFALTLASRFIHVIAPEGDVVLEDDVVCAPNSSPATGCSLYFFILTGLLQGCFQEYREYRKYNAH
jgi:hypothetical protein